MLRRIFQLKNVKLRLVNWPLQNIIKRKAGGGGHGKKKSEPICPPGFEAHDDHDTGGIIGSVSTNKLAKVKIKYIKQRKR